MTLKISDKSYLPPALLPGSCLIPAARHPEKQASSLLRNHNTINIASSATTTPFSFILSLTPNTSLLLCHTRFLLSTKRFLSQHSFGC